MLIPRREHVRGMRHIRGVMSAPSLHLRDRGRAERARERANIAVASAKVQASRQFYRECRRAAGGEYHHG